jgi:hypothetical protein
MGKIKSVDKIDNGIHRYQSEFKYEDVKSWKDLIMFGVSYYNKKVVVEILMCDKDDVVDLWLLLFELNYDFSFKEWFANFIMDDQIPVGWYGGSEIVVWNNHFKENIGGGDEWIDVLIQWMNWLKDDIVMKLDEIEKTEILWMIGFDEDIQKKRNHVEELFYKIK